MIKNRSGFIVALCALFLLALTSTLNAETVTATVRLGPDAVIPAPGTAAPTFIADMVMTIDVGRDGSGAVIRGAASFQLAVNFRGGVTITSVHLHNGAVDGAGPLVIDLRLGGVTFSPPKGEETGAALISISEREIDAATLRSILANPAGVYVDIHTPANPDGALRGQFHKFTETIANTITLSPANEVPPITNVAASGVATITINSTRNSVGAINGGNLTFSILYNLPAGSEITGLRIYKQAAGMNGAAVIDSGISDSNSIVTSTGKGTLSLTVPVDAGAVGELRQLVNDPTGFYVNLQTRSYGSGLIRGQMTSIATPPVIRIAGMHFLPTSATSSRRIELLVTGFDAGSAALINGREIPASPWQFFSGGGRLLIDIPSEMLTNAGTLFMQLRNAQGLLSAPSVIVVAPEESINPVAVTTVDAAKYRGLVAPESIVAAFGARLASRAVAATILPLPTKLDGTTVYVNGVAAGIFYVSEAQLNFVIPPSELFGLADIVVVAKDGTVSRGMVNVAATIPAIFTALGNGAGAPAGYAIKPCAFETPPCPLDSYPLSNPDGAPVPIDAGDYVVLFGTGMRFPSAPMKVAVGGVEIDPLFFGPQGFFEALDQVNLRIPQSLTGKGNIDLVLTLDGKSSNVVKLWIK